MHAVETVHRWTQALPQKKDESSIGSRFFSFPLFLFPLFSSLFSSLFSFFLSAKKFFGTNGPMVHYFFHPWTAAWYLLMAYQWQPHIYMYIYTCTVYCIYTVYACKCQFNNILYTVVLPVEAFFSWHESACNPVP